MRVSRLPHGHRNVSKDIAYTRDYWCCVFNPNSKLRHSLTWCQKRKLHHSLSRLFVVSVPLRIGRFCASLQLYYNSVFNVVQYRTMAAASNIRLPDPLSITGSAVADNWRRFKEQWDNYVLAADLDEASSEKQAAILLTCVGGEAYDVFRSFEFASAADRKKID